MKPQSKLSGMSLLFSPTLASHLGCKQLNFKVIAKTFSVLYVDQK